jgi:hypothetical protein
VTPSSWSAFGKFRKEEPWEDGTCALVLLGEGHDLTESVRRHAGGLCEYLRVTTRGYQEFAGEE